MKSNSRFGKDSVFRMIRTAKSNNRTSRSDVFKSFDIRNSLFDIRYLSAVPLVDSFFIRLNPVLTDV
jgi:hypothetical protein